jgi:hypothetical protein
MSDPITPLTPQQIAVQEAQAAHEAYIRRTLVALDQFANVLADGVPDMTISSRAAIAAEHGATWGRGLSRLLNLFQADHGADAAAGDLQRAETVEVLEEQALGTTITTTTVTTPGK